MSKGRILILHPHFTLPGGAGRHALETGTELARRGWDVHIASIRNTEALVSDYNLITFHELGGPLSSYLLFWIRLPYILWKVRRLIHHLAPDIVFSQVFPANWWGFVAKATMGKKVKHVWMCQEPSAFIHSTRWITSLPYSPAGVGARVLNPILKAIDTKLAKYVDAVFVNSHFSRQLALGAYTYAESQIGICYPGVDTTRFSVSATSQKKELQFVTCARLTKFKNIDRILHALSEMRPQPIKLIVIGDGEEYDNLVGLTQQLALEQSVVFRRSISDNEMITILQESVALIHAAEEEPFGLSPIEAMACGTPVIAIKGGGPAETVLHGQTGYLCESASPADLRVAMEWITSHKSFDESVQTLCTARARGFSWQSATDSLEAVFWVLKDHTS